MLQLTGAHQHVSPAGVTSSMLLLGELHAHLCMLPVHVRHACSVLVALSGLCALLSGHICLFLVVLALFLLSSICLADSWQ
jgi:hypothetical protein